MALTKLLLTPDKASYAVTDGVEALSVKLDGGRSKVRKDIVGSVSIVNVQWTLSPEQFGYFRSFYRVTTERASLPFELDLLLDSPELTTHEVAFIPGSVDLSGVDGNIHVVSGQLEAVPVAIDPNYDNAIIMLYNNYGNNSSEFVNQLETLANILLPASLA